MDHSDYPDIDLDFPDELRTRVKCWWKERESVFRELGMTYSNWYYPSQHAIDVSLACIVNEITPSWTSWYSGYYDSLVTMRAVGLAYAE